MKRMVKIRHMANTFRKIYKKIGNSGSDADYELIANVGVNGIDLDIMQGATAEADGEIGLVPKPSSGQQNYILSASGIWKNINDILDVDNLKIEIMKMIYPVKTIYVSTNNTNPATLFGFGTWVAWGSGRVPVGVSSNSNFNTVEKTGGSSTHSHTISVANKSAFTSGSTAITVAQMPSHAHAGSTSTAVINGSMRVCGGSGGAFVQTGNNHVAAAYSGRVTDFFDAVNSSVLPGGNHVHTFTTGNTGSGNGHTHSIPAHNHTASSNSASSLPPYITCYMWKRTA